MHWAIGASGYPDKSSRLQMIDLRTSPMGAGIREALGHARSHGYKYNKQ